MTPLPLKQIGPHWRDHLSALWWLGAVYRYPSQFEEQIAAALERKITIRINIMLALHLLPYIVVISIIGRFLLFGALGIELRGQPPIDWSTVLLLQGTLLVKGILVGSAVGIIGGIIIKIVFNINNSTSGVAFGITFWIACTLSLGIMGGITFGVTFGMVLGVILIATLGFVCLN